MKTNSPIQAPSGGKLICLRCGIDKPAKGWGCSAWGKSYPRHIWGEWNGEIQEWSPQTKDVETKTMTPIKTLEEVKKEFYGQLSKNIKITSFDGKNNLEIDAISFWNWFESTLSLLTEQMIPEEKDELKGLANMDNNIEDWGAWKKRQGFNLAISEMKKNREKILG